MCHGIRLQHVALLQSGRGHGLSAVWRRMGGHLHATVPEELLREDAAACGNAVSNACCTTPGAR